MSIWPLHGNEHYKGRLWGVIWMFFGIVMFAISAGQIASEMIEQSLNTGIASLDDIKIRSKIAIGSDVVKVARDELLLGTPVASIAAHSSAEEYTSLLESSKVDAVVGAVPRLLLAVETQAAGPNPIKFMLTGKDFAGENVYSHYFIARRSNLFVFDMLASLPLARKRNKLKFDAIEDDYLGVLRRGKNGVRSEVEESPWGVFVGVLVVTLSYAVSLG